MDQSNETNGVLSAVSNRCQDFSAIDKCAVVIHIRSIFPIPYYIIVAIADILHNFTQCSLMY